MDFAYRIAIISMILGFAMGCGEETVEPQQETLLGQFTKAEADLDAAGVRFIQTERFDDATQQTVITIKVDAQHFANRTDDEALRQALLRYIELGSDVLQQESLDVEFAEIVSLKIEQCHLILDTIP